MGPAASVLSYAIKKEENAKNTEKNMFTASVCISLIISMTYSILLLIEAVNANNNISLIILLPFSNDMSLWEAT